MLCLAVFDTERSRRKLMKNMTVRWLIQSRRDMDIIWFTDEDPVAKIRTYSSDIHIALICAGNVLAPKIGKTLRDENPACRIVYYDASNADTGELQWSMPSAYLDIQEESRFRSVMSAVVGDVLRSRAFFRYETKRELLMLPLEKIMYCQSNLKRISIFTDNGREYELIAKLDSIAGLLDSNFIRIHKSYIVNQKCVTSIRKSDKTAVLKDETILPFSNAQYHQALERFREFQNM